MKILKVFKNPLLVLLLTFIAFGAGVKASAQIPHPHLLRGFFKAVCSSGDQVKCNAKVVSDNKGNPLTSASLPSGYGPAQFHGAYSVPATTANPPTIGIVDAYNAPYIKSDLANYDKTFGLPVFPNCGGSVTASCFQVVNQSGQSSPLPRNDSGWALEISLDVETAHQMCQSCKLVLVEARSSNYSDLMTAVDRARLMGATVISNSYGSNEFSGETAYDSHFNYPGIAFLFSSGDNGYGASYPAGSSLVTAVGGTSLTVSNSNTWQSETAWSGGGSGCSAFESKPALQLDTGCKQRTIADVSADADPNTGAAVYDSYRYGFQRGWFQVGGTSLASPLIAGIYALANNVGSNTFANSVPYANLNYGVNMHDITSGSNGSCGNHLCQAGTGFDGPTGLGSPLGFSAF